MPLLIAILGGSEEQGLNLNGSIIIDLFVNEVKRIMPYKRCVSADTSQDSASAEGLNPAVAGPRSAVRRTPYGGTIINSFWVVPAGELVRYVRRRS